MELVPEDLSSNWTFFYKFLFAPLWIGGFGMGTLTLVISSSSSATGPMSPESSGAIFLFFIFLAVSAYLYWTCIRLKSVRMDSTFLYVSNYRKEIKIPLTHIVRVSEWWLDNTHPVFVYFSRPTDFGDSIVFMPKFRWFSLWSSHPVVGKIREAMGQPGIAPY